MAKIMIKYNGKEKKLLTIDGVERWIQPGSLFSGDEHLLKFDDFESLTPTVKPAKIPHPNNLKFDVVDYGTEPFKPFFDISFLKNNALPKISICIVTKDGWGVIDRCIKSIQEYNKYKNYEILVCDTGTTDPNVLIFYSQIENELPIKIFKGHTYNFSKNNNFLATQATGDVLLFMNNDVFLTYDAISEMVKYILCSTIGCLGHRLVWRDRPHLIQHDGQILYKSDGNWHGPGHHNLGIEISKVSNENKVVEGVTAAFLMIRKNLFFEVGCLDEAYKDIYQDVDLNLKVAKKGYTNFCIRKKALIHVDHSTRKTDATPDSYKDAERFHFGWRLRPFQVSTKPKHSILVCATKEEQLQSLRNSIKSVIPHEIIFANNRNNYMTSAQSLNVLTDIAQGEILYYVHQDVTFEEKDVFRITEKRINELHNNFGILGIAGVKMDNTERVSDTNFSTNKYNFTVANVQTVDEFLMITKKTLRLQFDEETMNHFHFYGADICCSAMKRGLKNYVVSIKCTHHSTGSDNLKYGDGYERFTEQGYKFYKKWYKDFPYIATTTTNFTPQRIYYYIGAVIGLKPDYKYFTEGELP